MAEFKRIPLKEIFVPERLRTVEEEHALAIAQSIVEHGLLNPVTVRRTPAKSKGATPYTLIAGAHRLRATEMNDESEIEAIIVEADQAEAQLIEITENIFRNELSVMDRAIFVQTYREVWEQRYGKIESGRPGNRANLAQLFEDAPQGSFSQHAADRMGLSARAVKRLNQIATHLHADLRTAIRGTPTADNQSTLLNLAKMEPKKQRQVAIAFKAEGDLKKALALVAPAPAAQNQDETAKQGALLSRLVAAWKDADENTQAQFLAHIGVDLDVRREAAE